jgi:pimeloyl-ACP methyl ester carboxylesterase
MTTQKGYVASNGGAQLYYEIDGADNAETLVFVHAGVADLRLWQAQAAHFAAHYRVIRYDMRGFGKSEPVDGPSSMYDDLVAVMAHFAVKQAHLIGCSMGGGCCMDYTLQHPDRVLSLTMVGSGPEGLYLDVAVPEIFDRIEAAEARGEWDTVAELHTQAWFEGYGRDPHTIDPAARAIAYDMCRLMLTHKAKKLGSDKPPFAPPAAERLGELRTPLLVIVGAHDEEYLLRAADYMAQHVPHAHKVQMPNTAHLPSLDQPAAFNAILGDWLAKRAA